jgi:hypothetical protein
MATKKQEMLNNLDSFTEAYLEAALWSSNDNADDSGGEPLDANYDVSDFTVKALAEAIRECANFQEEHSHLWTDSSHAGHDFWLSRNGHGAGFFDGPYPRDIRAELQKAAKTYGSCDIYVDSGKLHFG